MASRRRREHRARRTAEDRAQWARERQALVGKLITQEGWIGALVKEHIRGSQYLIRLADGQEVYASHKKQRRLASGAFTEGGWRIWED
tara:strand:+ start:574 stop:837 length:264 start_codon:yes stop_codon:yes gene_type:complete